MKQLLLFIYEFVQFFLYYFLILFRFLSVKLNKFLFLRSPIQFIKNIHDAKNNYSKLGLNSKENPIFWFHVSSAGEMEQAIPIARKLHQKMGAYFFVTYYSFSAEPFIKNFPATIGVFGLPIDIRFLYQRLLATFEIKKIFFVRYDIWPSLLISCKKNNVEINLLSATKLKTRTGLRAYFSQKWNFIFYHYFSNMFAVEKEDAEFFIHSLPSVKVFQAGDGKWARALERSQSKDNFVQDKNFAKFISFSMEVKNNFNKKILVLGSPHEEEHKIALQLASCKDSFLLIYVPHDVNEAEIISLKNEFQLAQFHCETYSELFLENGMMDDIKIKINVIIVDRIGFLAEIYQIAEAAIIGGGFDGQIHNVLEAAACGAPTLFGPSFARAREASQLIAAQAALSFESPKKMFHFLSSWVNFDTQGTNSADPQEKLSLLRGNALRLFENIPNTSEVVLNAFQKQ